MKRFKNIAWFILVLFLALLGYVMLAFQVEDMTLFKGDVYSFNEGWVITGEDGETHTPESLPFSGESKPKERVVMENTIPKEYWGLSMSFLSADKMLTVFVDGEKVYEFGTKDKRRFGKTPGSVVNFVDIPAELKQGDIRVEMVSPYADYGAKISDIRVGKRDVLVLALLVDNAFAIFCGFIIVICGIGFAFLSLVQQMARQESKGLMQMCGYCMIAAVYYFIETKALTIFYGNQTLYSVTIFLCLLFMPLLMGIYYASGKMGVYKKRWHVLLSLICINIFLQVLLQMCHVFDFMEMSFVSHGFITVTMLVIGKSYVDYIRENGTKGLLLEMVALFLMAVGGLIDISRTYIIGVGDLGKFSRYATALFCLIMLYKHFRQITMGYSDDIEENAKRIQQEMAKVERKNEELKKANERAEEAKQEALLANASKGKFLAHMSHEIRTPINAVLGMDTMILRESKELQIKEYALDIQNAGQSLLALINDILDFSKIESGKLEIISVEYDLSSMIHDISNMIGAKVSSKKLDFHICVAEDLPSRLLGDDVRIRQVLVNLLNNAVKYTHEGAVTLRIDGKTEENRVVMYFSVEDTGIGIKEEDISKLFQEFERIEEKRNRNIEGTGLGINITTQLLLLMGSKLQVESVYGEGSRFYFTLEQQIVDGTPIGNLEERIRQKNTEYSYQEVFTAPKAHILVVDDNVINLKVFINLLKTTKVNVDIAGGGISCLEMVKKKHYDLIFLDHMMPDLDGVETLHRMKALPEYPCKDTPVIALTANAITGAREMYMAEGFDAFLSKPINPEKLEQMILMLLPRELLEFEVQEKEEQEIASSMRNWQEEMTAEEEMPSVDGVDWNYGLLHLPSKEMLLDTVEDFYKTMDCEAAYLEQAYEKLDDSSETWRQYRVKVHAMKSAANVIGASAVGGLAKLLENGAKEENREVVMSLTPVFLKEWRTLKENLQVCIRENGEKQEIEDFSEITSYLEQVGEALEELDIDTMDEYMEKLEKFLYPDEIQKEIERLAGLVADMDSEQAQPVIAKLKQRMREHAEQRGGL